MLFLGYLKNNFFYWSIVALQCCFTVSFCCTAEWISYTCASVCSFRFPSLLGHHRSLSGVLCAEQWVLINYVLCTVVYLHQSYPLGYFLTSFLSCFWYYLGKSLGRKSGRHTKPYQIRGACHVFDKILFGSFWYIALTHLESLQY